MEHDKFVAEILMERCFRGIPDWLVMEVNNDVLINIFDFASEKYQSALDSNVLNEKVRGVKNENIIRIETQDAYYYMADFLSRVRYLGDISISKLAKKMFQCTRYPSEAFLNGKNMYSILAHLFQSNSDWKIFLREFKKYQKNERVFFYGYYSDVISAMKIHYHRFGKIPLSLVSYLFWLFETYNYRFNDEQSSFITSLRVFFNTWYGEDTVETLLDIDMGEFIHDFVISARKLSTKYNWVSHMFSDNCLWNNRIPFYPDIPKDNKTVVNYLYTMDGSNLEVVNSTKDALFDFLNENDDICEEEFLELENTIRELILVKNIGNINNIKLLIPIVEKRPDKIPWAMDIMTEVLNSLGRKKCLNLPLRDFGSVREFFGIVQNDKSFNNDIVQKNFLKQGGNPNTLLTTTGNKDSYIYTVEGIECALKYSKFEHVSKLLNDPIINEIVLNDIIGKVPFSPDIETIALHVERNLGNKEHCNYACDLRDGINAYYPVSQSVCEPTPSALRISNLSRMMAFDIIKMYPNSVFNIPFYLQNFDDLFRNISSVDHYVPLWFGMNYSDDVGLENFLKTDQIVFLLKISPSYIADVKDEKIASTLMDYRFLWED